VLTKSVTRRNYFIITYYIYCTGIYLVYITNLLLRDYNANWPKLRKKTELDTVSSSNPSRCRMAEWAHIPNFKLNFGERTESALSR